ncbi:MAG: leucine-rich repeat domain-containing protein [Lachnospiraceae bacterium]|nr:leucine-rich repeat domain-containing protein [Lachnospiraceae bacterium]
MNKYVEYQGENYYLTLQEINGELAVTGCGGVAHKVEVPEYVEGKRVVEIAKKAFLSRKNIRELILPRTILSIGDWAFAYCGKLERIVLPEGVEEIGKSVFANCQALQQVNCLKVKDGHGWSEDVSHLLAAAVKDLEAYYLLEPMAAGGQEWFAKWDARLLAVMEEDDYEGYQKQVLCGEEDYGSTDLGAFLTEKRKKKVRLCMLRLQHEQGLTEELRAYLTGYLLAHTKGCESEETWQVLLQERTQDRESWELFLELGCATKENMDAMLADIGEQYPEMKAYFLRYQADTLGYGDFFAGLEL